MATVRTVTVKASGGDYASLSAAEAGEQADLVALDRQLTIECYAFEDTTNVILAGWVTDASRYLRVYVPPAQRHNGKWSTTAYRSVGSAYFGQMRLNNGASLLVLKLEGLQLEQTLANDSTKVGLYADASGLVDLEIDSCIIRCTDTAPAFNTHGIWQRNSAPGTKVKMRNTLIYGFAGICASFSAGTGGEFAIYNCLAYGGTTGFQCAKQSNDDVVTVRRKNNIAQGQSGSGYNLGWLYWTTDDANNISGDSSAPGTGSKTNTTVSFADAANGDFQLASGDTAAKDAGTSLAADATWPFTTDAAGTARPQGSAWDIGALEYVAAGGGGVTLTVQSATHGHVAEAPTVTQANVLAVAGALHALASEAPALTAALLLAVSDALHSHAADAPALTQAYVLVVQDTLHVLASDSPFIGDVQVLSVDDAVHAHTADIVAIVVVAPAHAGWTGVHTRGSSVGSWAAPCRPEVIARLRFVQQADGDLYLTDSPFLAAGRAIPLVSGSNGLALDDGASSGLSLRKSSSGIAAYDT